MTLLLKKTLSLRLEKKNNIKVKMMSLPNDPMMLFSFINMKLRDNYSSLDDLCEDLDVNKNALMEKLKAAGFEYSPEYNKFW